MTDKIIYTAENDVIVIKLCGDFINYSDDAAKSGMLSRLKNKTKIVVCGEKINNWDSSLAVILFKIIEYAGKNGMEYELKSIPKGAVDLMTLAFKVDRKPTVATEKSLPFFDAVGTFTVACYDAVCSAYAFLDSIAWSLLRFCAGRARYRRQDFYTAMEDCSYKAFPIVALISFMVGMILSFVGAMQLKIFGAEIYVASLVMVSMVRVMGALMTGIIMAGRTGASYAATIGTMQVNEEVDALKTMGVPEIDFLLLPRMVALMVMMPLLTVMADFIGVIGGGLVGIFVLDLPIGEYVKNSLNSLFMNHFLVGIFHGFVFGVIIAMCGCYYGIKCEKDAESVGKSTTSAVVSSIVLIIVATAVITVLCEVLKI